MISKNKSPLIDARKNIESQMERFKLLERESKTKLYSKAGLAMNRRNSSDSDDGKPRLKTDDPRKLALYDWIDEQIEALNQQSEELERRAEEASEAKPVAGHKGKKGRT